MAFYILHSRPSAAPRSSFTISSDVAPSAHYPPDQRLCVETGASRCFQISAANVLLGVAICFCVSHRSCAEDGLLAAAFARLLLGVIMCASCGSPTGVHEFVLYRHSSLSQSRHSEGREPCRDGVDFRGPPFIAQRGFWAAAVSPHCSIMLELD